MYLLYEFGVKVQTKCVIFQFSDTKILCIKGNMENFEYAQKQVVSRC